MNKYKLSLLAISIAAVVGCKDGGGAEGNSSGNSIHSEKSYQALVIERNFRTALVWLDENNNYQVDEEEPKAYASANGTAKLDISNFTSDPKTIPLIASINQTMVDGNGESIEKSYVMSSPPGIQIISPVTHFIHSKQQAQNSDPLQAISQAADLMDGITEQNLRDYFVNPDNKKIQNIATNLRSLMPVNDVNLNQQQIIDAHPRLEQAIVAIKSSDVDKKTAKAEQVVIENPKPETSGETTEAVSILPDVLPGFVSNKTVEHQASPTPDAVLNESAPEPVAPVPDTGLNESIPEPVAPTPDAVLNESTLEPAAPVPDTGLTESTPEPVAPLPDTGLNESAPESVAPVPDIAPNESAPEQTAPAPDSFSNNMVENSTLSQESTALEGQTQANDLLDLDTLLNRVVPDFLAAEKTAAQNSSTTVEGLANQYVSSLKNGYWSDIVYSATDDKNWTPAIHLKRMETIATAFYTTKKVEYKTALNGALAYWFRYQPSSTGWWGNIGQSISLAKIALLLGNELSVDLKSKINALLPSQSGTGDIDLGRIDVAVGVIYKGVLTQNSDLVRDGIKEIEQIVETTVPVGTEPDWSFLLNQRLNSGKTGKEYFYSALHWAYKVKDLPWKFSERSSEILAIMLLDGVLWLESPAQLNTNTSATGSITAQAEGIQNSGSASQVITEMDMIEALVPARKDEVIQYESSGLSGFKHFWRSDSTVTAIGDVMVGIDMDTKRTVSTSNTTGEATFDFWSGLGNTSLTQTGVESTNIAAVVDWTKIPGVTIPAYKDAPTYDAETMRSTSFIGGGSNGSVGVTTMAINMSVVRPVGSGPNDIYSWQVSTVQRDYLKAYKSWFSSGDQIIALGAGISSTHSETVNTTLNQTFLNGPVTLSNRTTLPLYESEPNVSGMDWVHHDNVGYVFLDQSTRIAALKSHLGEWSDINNEVSWKNVFTLWVSHGSQPVDSSYQYIILPNKTVGEVTEFYQRMPVRVIENSKRIQAVEDTQRNVVSAVFFEPGELVVSNNYKVTVDKPSVVILDASGTDIDVSISTPGTPYSVVKLKVQRDLVTDIQTVVTPGTEEQLGRSVHFLLSQGQLPQTITDPLALDALNRGF